MILGCGAQVGIKEASTSISNKENGQSDTPPKFAGSFSAGSEVTPKRARLEGQLMTRGSPRADSMEDTDEKETSG